ncbi:MAG: response regulator [Fimbriimonas sp.]|nr:response regulator [Fimbriimonas sp.]
MTAEISQILILHGSPSDCDEVRGCIDRLGDNYHYVFTTCRAEFEKAAGARRWDMIICCADMPDYDIANCLLFLRSVSNIAPVLVVSSVPSNEVCDRVFELGAWDYITPRGYPRLPWTIKNLIKDSRLQDRMVLVEAQHVRLFDEAPYGIVLIDRDGTLLQANTEVSNQVLYSPSELVGKSIFEFVPAGDRALFEARFAESFSLPHPREVSYRGEAQVLRKDGTTFPAEVSVRSMPEPESHLTIARISDLTDKKALELSLSRTDRLTAIGKFAGGIAHDLNNALAPVLMAIELLILQQSEPNSLLDTAKIGASRCRDLLRELLTYSRGGAIDPERIDTSALLVRFRDLVQPRLDARIDLQISTPEGLSDLWGDPTQILQVLTNLAHNGADAMPNGGCLTLSAEDVYVDERSAPNLHCLHVGGYVRFTVADTGLGIESKDIAQIFEPFFTTKKHGKGMGLGLSIVSSIVESHYGQIDVASVPGKGTTFTIHLPVASKVGVPSVSPALDVAVAKARDTILVVDDDPGARSAIMNAVTALHWNVLSANDGMQALNTIENSVERLSCMVTDLRMPGMDGVELTKVVKEKWPELRVVVVSGDFWPGSANELRDLGVHTLLQKPVSLVALMSALPPDLRSD